MKALDLHSLHVFATVCEKGSMTAAAESLGMTQSAVSQHIKQIEEAIGVTLVDRGLRPMRPTPAGIILFERGKRLLAEADEARTLARQCATGGVPILRVGVIYSLSKDYVIQLATAVLAQPSPPSLSIWTGLDLEHGRALLNRELDIVITADPLEDIDNLERYDLIREPFLLVIPASHAPEDAKLDLRRLAAELPLIRYSGRSLIGTQIERHLRRLRIVPPRLIEFDSSDAVAEMVALGRGWSLLTPLGLLHSGVDPARVRPLRFPGPGFTRRLTLVSREREFGQTPGILARLSRDILRRTYLPKLASIRPWLPEVVTIAPAG